MRHKLLWFHRNVKQSVENRGKCNSFFLQCSGLKSELQDKNLTQTLSFLLRLYLTVLLFYIAHLTSEFIACNSFLFPKNTITIYSVIICNIYLTLDHFPRIEFISHLFLIKKLSF